MSPENENSRENKYDKIMRENLETPSDLLLGYFFPGEVLEALPLPNRLRLHIIEQETDTLILVKMKGKQPFIFHLEFQTTNDTSMSRRMASYDFMLHLKYNMNVVGVVIYVGKDSMKMTGTVKFNNNLYNCELIDIRSMDAALFLQSGRAGEIIFAILASYNIEESRIIIQKILAKLRDLLPHSGIELKQRIKQLEIIGDLRGEDIQKQIIQEEEKMTILYDLTKDLRYKQGKSEGKTEGKAEAALKIAESLIKAGMSLALIQEHTGVSESTLFGLTKSN